MKPDPKHGIIQGDRRDGLKETAPPKPGYAFTIDDDTPDLVGPSRQFGHQSFEGQLLACDSTFMFCILIFCWIPPVAMFIASGADTEGWMLALIWMLLFTTSVTGLIFLTRWARHRLEASTRDSNRPGEPR